MEEISLVLIADKAPATLMMSKVSEGISQLPAVLYDIDTSMIKEADIGFQVAGYLIWSAFSMESMSRAALVRL